MKRRCAFALFILPAVSWASSYGGAEGRNRAGETIHFGADTFYELYVQQNEDDHIWAERYDLNAVCPDFAKAMASMAEEATFSCPVNGKFPLSGAT